MAITGTHHVSFSVTDLEKSVDFYQNVLGLELRAKTRNNHEGLGTGLFGTKWGLNQSHADLQIAVMELGGVQVEFIEYRDPKAQPYHMNPSIAGSAHLAIRVKDIEGERSRLENKGVEFHSPINVFHQAGKPDWKWCYFRDPDGICLELVEEV